MATFTVSSFGGDWDGLMTFDESSTPPTAADNVVCNASSGDLTINVNAVCRSIDCNGYTGTLTRNASTTWAIGDGTAGANNRAMRFVSGMTYTNNSANAISFQSSSATQQSITSGGKTLGPISIGNGGSYILGDNLTLGGQLAVLHGTLNDGGFSVSATNTETTSLSSSTITMSGTWTLTGSSGTVWEPPDNLTATGSTILLSDTGGSDKTFSGSGKTYNILQIAMGGAGVVTINGASTFAKINRSGTGAKTVKFNAAVTQTLTGGEDAFLSGTSGNVITIASGTQNTAFTISKASGNLVCDYISLEDSTASGGATFYAGDNSTDVDGNSGWTFSGVPGPPVLTSIDPESGSTAGGTTVTLTGTDFVDGATVTFGGDAATNVTFNSDTEIECDTPAHAAGAVDVVVENPDEQTDTLTSAFTYVAPPSLDSLDPATGTTAGGTAVTLTGSNFVATPTVTFGGQAATDVVRVNSTSVTCATPAHAAGAVDVVVTNPDTQSDTLTEGFEYVTPAAGGGGGMSAMSGMSGTTTP